MSMRIEQILDLIAGKLVRWLQDGIVMLPNVVVAILVMVLFGVMARLGRQLVRNILSAFTENEDVGRLVGIVVYAAALAAGAFIALGVLHLDKTVTSLLTGVGILGLTLGFALQDVASNLVAGLLIALGRPFRIGDVIETNNFFGRVDQITLRDTRLTQLDGQIVLVPNREIFGKPIINHTAAATRRVDLEVNVSYRADLDQVLNVAQEAIAAVEGRDPSREIELFFKSLGDSTLTLMMRFWIHYGSEVEYLRARSAAIRRVKHAFDAHDLAGQP
jgi:small conductance mechanosensitive channel